jgi:hypothetical protein
LGTGEVLTGFWWGILRARDQLEYPDVDDMIILKTNLQNVGWGDIDWVDLT